LAIEKGSAGAKYHGVADEGVPFGEIADVIGRHLKSAGRLKAAQPLWVAWDFRPNR
jgi:hypothetical protein